MPSIPFINQTNKSKFIGAFIYDNINYNYTLYLLPLKKKIEAKEIVSYFGNRMFKGQHCLEITEESVKELIINSEVSAFIIVKPENVDNAVSGTLQVFDWCINPPSDNNIDLPPNLDEADVWINDVCRVANGENSGNPLKAFFFFVEQLVVQNLGKLNIKLYIETHEPNRSVLQPKYETLGFNNNAIDDATVCPNWTGEELVMEKSGLVAEQMIINFDFLKVKQTNKLVGTKRSYGTMVAK